MKIVLINLLNIYQVEVGRVEIWTHDFPSTIIYVTLVDLNKFSYKKNKLVK